MIITRYAFAIGLCMTILLSGISPIAGQSIHSAFDSDSQERITNGVMDQPMRIMPQFNALNFGLGRFGNHSIYYEKSLSRIFFQDQIITAKITGIEIDGTHITLRLFHPVKGIGVVTFIFNANLISEVSDDVIEDILLNTLGDENHRYVFGNPESRRYHLYSCLHTEANSHLIRMSRDEAENRGFQPGGFCFNNMVYLPDLVIEREIEINWLARLREHALFMDGSPNQDTVNRLGHQILDNWPFRLLGYNYSFHVINSHHMTVLAIPTGKVFITTSLMDALESEQEVEALLARAIAHIENRHSLKQYYSKTNAAKNMQFLQKLTMATGSFSGIFAGPGSSAIKALGKLPFHVSSGDQPLSSGYEDNLERAADALAALYFDIRQKDRRHLSAAIRKLQLADLYFNSDQSARFSLDAVMSNLEIDEMTKQLYFGMKDNKRDVRIDDRATNVEQIKFRHFTTDSSFVLQQGRLLPVQLDLMYQSIIHNENRVVLYLSDKFLLHHREDFQNNRRISLLITDKRERHRFKLLKSHTTEDMWGAQVTFEAPRDKRSRFLEGLQDIEIEIVKPQGSVGKADDREILIYHFVKGRLDAENQVADRHQADS